MQNKWENIEDQDYTICPNCKTKIHIFDAAINSELIKGEIEIRCPECSKTSLASIILGRRLDYLRGAKKQLDETIDLIEEATFESDPSDFIDKYVLRFVYNIYC